MVGHEKPIGLEKAWGHKPTVGVAKFATEEDALFDQKGEEHVGVVVALEENHMIADHWARHRINARIMRYSFLEFGYKRKQK
jgi:hypothetical protein